MRNVVAAVIEQDGRILVCQRRAHERHALKWEFPGGKVEAGETAPQALRRELEEELGICAEIGPEITRYPYSYQGRPALLLIFFQVTKFAGEIQNRIFEQVEWAEQRKLADYDFLEGDCDFVRELAKGQRGTLKATPRS